MHPVSETHEVRDPSGVSYARRKAGYLADRAGLDDDSIARVELVVTEAGNNLVRHSEGGGWIIVFVTGDQPAAIELVALDEGPGLEPRTAIEDGFSTGGGPGWGLGSMSRTADRFDVFSIPGQGTAVFARIDHVDADPDPLTECCGVVRNFPGEEVSGDAWRCFHTPGGVSLALVDALGHGYLARDSAARALEAAEAVADVGPAIILRAMDDALRAESVRGAVGGVATFEPRVRKIRFAGVGNIEARLILPGGEETLLSSPGTLGRARNIKEIEREWTTAFRVVLHTDGLTHRWKTDRWGDLWTPSRSACVAASVLMRDLWKGNDDAAAAVLQINRAANGEE